MIILGIESSCDDTSVALVKATRGKFEILAEKTASQIDIHKKYGGVVPEIAGRMHAEKILPLIETVLESTLIKKPDVICVTSGPGLITGLMVGVEAAKTLSYLWNVPLVGVNHIEGHIHSVEIPNDKLQISKQLPITNYQLPKIKYPALALIASGGHTELILIKSQGKLKKIGATLDDAAGECFDKVAKLLEFEYPGGPKISKCAENGNAKAINFPRPMLNSKDFNFSFSGLKTSALYWLRDNKVLSSSFQEKEYRPESGRRSLPRFAQSDGNSLLSARADILPLGKRETTLSDFCASFEQAIIDVLVGKTIKAAQKFKPKTIILGGGVAANKKLRETLRESISTTSPNTKYLIPDTKYSMDNATMIAIAGYYKAKDKKFTKWNKLVADPNWEVS